jgi:hypothetical protein
MKRVAFCSCHVQSEHFGLGETDLANAKLDLMPCEIDFIGVSPRGPTPGASLAKGRGGYVIASRVGLGWCWRKRGVGQRVDLQSVDGFFAHVSRAGERRETRAAHVRERSVRMLVSVNRV